MAYCYLDDDYYKITLEIVEDFIKLDYIKFINNGYDEKYPKILKMEIVLHLKKLDDIVDIKVRKYFLLNVKRKINKRHFENKKNDVLEVEIKEDCNLNIVKIIFYFLENEKKLVNCSYDSKSKEIETITIFLNSFLHDFCYNDIRNSFKYANFYINKNDYERYSVNAKLRLEDLNNYIKDYYEKIIISILSFTNNEKIEKIIIAEKNIINHVKKVYGIDIEFIFFK